MLASILIVTRNDTRTLRTAVRCALNQSLPENECEVIVLDDCSGEEQSSILSGLEEEYREAVDKQHLRIFREKQHRGLSRGRNLAAKHAKGEILLYMDGDGYPDNTWAREISNVFSDPQIGAAASNVTLARAPGITDSIGCTMNRYGDGKNRYSMLPSSLIKEPPTEVLFAMGCGMAIRKSALLQCNGFDESIMNYYDDADICMRIWREGFRIITAPDAHVLHDTNSYSPGISRQKRLLLYRNQWLTTLKHWPIHWLIINTFFLFATFIKSPVHLLHSFVFIRAGFTLIPSIPAVIRYRLRTKRKSFTHIKEHLYPHFTGPETLNYDPFTLSEKYLTPVRSIYWPEIASLHAYASAGSSITPDSSSMLLINGGWIQLPLFWKTRHITLSATVCNPDTAITVTDNNENTLTSIRAGSNSPLEIQLTESCDWIRLTAHIPGAIDNVQNPEKLIQIHEIAQS